MNIIENTMISSILILFPISIYLIYLSYMEYHRSKLFLICCIEVSLILLLYYQGNYLYLSILNMVPFVVSSLFIRSKIINVVNSLLLILFYNLFLSLNIYLLLLEFILYLVIDYIIKKDDLKLKILFITIIFFYCLHLVILNRYNILLIIIEALVFIINIIIIKLFIIKSYKVNNIITSSKKDKLLYKSLSKLTHELKNPIAVCKGYLDMIDQKGINNTKNYLPIISEEINRTLTVINDFSLLNKSNNLYKEEADLYLLLEDVVICFNPIFEKSNSKIIFNKLDKELYVNIDYNKIKQVLINIIKNCLEARDQTRELVVEINIREYKNIYKIIIKDNGIGMDEDILKNMKNMFYTTKEQGNGIGVNLIYEIINLHNGNVKYKSSLNKGTTVEITLPFINKKSLATFNSSNYC